jgi:hypothetical protein
LSPPRGRSSKPERVESPDTLPQAQERRNGDRRSRKCMLPPCESSVNRIPRRDGCARRATQATEWQERGTPKPSPSGHTGTAGAMTVARSPGRPRWGPDEQEAKWLRWILIEVGHQTVREARPSGHGSAGQPEAWGGRGAGGGEAADAPDVLPHGHTAGSVPTRRGVDTEGARGKTGQPRRITTLPSGRGRVV